MAGSATGVEVAGADAGLRRDRPTQVSYGALGAYAFWLYAFGPALALLRVEMHLSYTLVGVYSALWAAGACCGDRRWPPPAEPPSSPSRAG